MALDHDDGVSNPSDNRPFEDVLASHLSRRTVIAGGLTAAALAFMGTSAVVEAGVPEVPMSPGRHRGDSSRGKCPLIDFAPAPNAGGPDPTISDDYRWDVVIPWGSPLLAGGSDIDGGRPGSEAEALKQIGIGHDGMHFFPIRRRNDFGVLCINHEFGDNTTVIGKERPERLEEVRISQAVHGNSVVKLRKRPGSRATNRTMPPTALAVEIGGVAIDRLSASRGR